MLFDNAFELPFHGLLVFVGSFPSSPRPFDDIFASPFDGIPITPLPSESDDIFALGFDDLLRFSVLLL